ncbi:hypothetical protein [Actinoplanes solisilvae]|uniref:hypothetical protein n=1 Tax=Actinoplanes solisilvae TaxID=2486853 RepID=UPI000FD81394|nr:hypothetical protein [Actinoplanes solisilvae]
MLDLAGVGQDRPQALRPADEQFHVFAQGSAQELFHLADDVIQVDHLRLDHLTTGEGQQLVRQSRGALRGSFDLADVALRREEPLRDVFLGGLAPQNPIEGVLLLRPNVRCDDRLPGLADDVLRRIPVQPSRPRSSC